MGIREESGELIVGIPEGIVKARDFRRHGVFEERWNIQKSDSFRGIPWATIPGREMDDIKSRIDLPPRGALISMDNSIPKSTHPPRRMKLSQEDVIKAGFTDGCPGCADIHASMGRCSWGSYT